MRKARLAPAVGLASLRAMLSATAGGNDSGFKNVAVVNAHAGDVGCPSGSSHHRIGDVLPSGFRFEAIPDGISINLVVRAVWTLFVNHEDDQGAVPVQHGDADGGQRRERLRQRPGEQADPQPAPAGILNGSFVVPSRAGYQAAPTSLRRRRKGSIETSCSPTRRRSTTSSASRTRGHRRSATPTRSRSASSWHSTSEPGSTRRSPAWEGITTRTRWRFRGTTTWSSCPETTRSRAGLDDPAGRTDPGWFTTVTVPALLVRRR